MDSNIELAIAVFLGLWLGRSTTIADYGAKIYFDILGLLIDIGINKKFRIHLFWFALGAVGAIFDVEFFSFIAFWIADKLGEKSVRLSKERYLPAVSTIVIKMPEMRQVSLFDYNEQK